MTRMHSTRRDFLVQAASVPALSGEQTKGAIPWYRRCRRWGQTNITEKDPIRYDIAFWRDYWKRTRVQGVIINAGGIVAYYPSKFELHHRAQYLNGRDLYGELCRAAHDDGLAVLARMDSNRAAEDFHKAHPDWFAVDAAGRPYRAADKYITCVNSPYYDEWIPGILREIIERSHPQGVTDNSWAGLGRASICYCGNCRRKFRDKTGRDLPRRKDWEDSGYREWILWNYARRVEIWEINNRTTKSAGGPDCLWCGMNSGSISHQCASFRDYKAICERSEILMLDHQRRNEETGFQQNAECGKLIHGILGWDKLIPESMPMYMNARNSFRLAAKPAAEARMWMVSGFAGGIQPWWHHVGAFHEDRRAYETAGPVMRWHEQHGEFLVNRTPVSAVGMVWTQRNTDFYGRDDAGELVDLPWRGFSEALLRARIPFLPVHADHIARDAGGLSVLILPDVAALSDEQCGAIRRFAAAGGSVVATGVTSLYTEMGDVRKDFALADLFRAHAPAGLAPAHREQAGGTQHTYLRIGEPRHAILEGFDGTAILAFGGMLAPMAVEPGAAVPLTFIPPFPIYPPETAWMREETTNLPAAILSEHGKSARVAFLPADIDRRFAREHLPDHSRLLGNILRWALNGRAPLVVEGPGLVDCHLYRQGNRFILHLVNLSYPGAWRSPIDELLPAGPFRVKVRMPPGATVRSASLLVAGSQAAVSASAGWAVFEVKRVADHEVAVIT